jgi:hypothetical protein
MLPQLPKRHIMRERVTKTINCATASLDYRNNEEYKIYLKIQ